MTDRTIRIAPLSDQVTKKDVLEVFSTFSISRVHKQPGEAYVEFQTSDQLGTLEFAFPDNKIDTLENATYEPVSGDFVWNFTDSTSSINSLKDDKSGDSKTEHPINLTKPDPKSVVTVSNCDVSILDSMTTESIRTSLFSGFESVIRLLKKGDQLFVEFQNEEEIKLLEQKFPGLKVPALGENASIELTAEVGDEFGQEWIMQEKRESSHESAIKEIQESPQKFSESEPVKGHCLHQEILPRLNKLTSMETDFAVSNEKTEEEAPREVIHQHQSEHDEHKVEGQNTHQNVGFFLDDQQKRQEEEELQKERLAQIKRQDQERRQKELQEQQRQRKLKEQARIDREKRQQEKREQDRKDDERRDKERREEEEARKIEQERVRLEQERKAEAEKIERERIAKAEEERRAELKKQEEIRKVAEVAQQSQGVEEEVSYGNTENTTNYKGNQQQEIVYDTRPKFNEKEGQKVNTSVYWIAVMVAFSLYILLR